MHEKTPASQEDLFHVKTSELFNRLEAVSLGRYNPDLKSSVSPEEYEAKISSIADALNTEIERRVSEFILPDEIQKAGEKYAAALPAATSREEHQRLISEWEKLKAQDPRYEIAIKLASINLPVNQGDEERLTKIVRKDISKYLEQIDI